MITLFGSTICVPDQRYAFCLRLLVRLVMEELKKPRQTSDGAAYTNGSCLAVHARTNTDSLQVGVLKGSDYLKLGVCSACGFVFGVAAEKSRIHIPSVIQQQMLFTENTMLKAFIAAVSSSAAMFSVLYLLPVTRSLFNQVREEFGGCVTTKKVLSFAAGGAILGMGMTIAGACPGMVIVQVGAGTNGALVTLLGCFTGALLYGAVEPYLRSHIATNTHPYIHKSIWLDRILGAPYITMAVGVALLTGAIAIATEYLVPWTTVSVPSMSSDVGWRTQKAWSPIYAGLVMGSLQLPIAMTVRDSLGGSSSYCTIIAQSRLSQAMPYFSSFTSGLTSWWQVMYWAGAAGGAALSASMSGVWGLSTDVSFSSAFFGGVLMLFGARLASGCTSGHGLSGLALLSLASFVAVPAMFVGGISLAGALRLIT